METIKDRSQVSRGSALVMGAGVAFFLGMALVSLYGWSRGYPPKPFELFTELMLAAVLAGRAMGRYICELDEKELRITGTTLLGFTRVHLLPYDRIIGLYLYAPQLVGVMSFRRTRRLQSALDSRPVWTVAYRELGKGGVPENCRVYLKMSGEMLDSLKGRLAASVADSEEFVATRQVAMEK